MALSQVQCLDNNNVNWRSSESKPEFFYSEEQRLALEALVSKGAEAFYEVLKKENIRDFLSELELKKILDGVEPFDPGSSGPRVEKITRGNSSGGDDQEDDEGEISLEYWPERSDHSIPELDLGWPETVAYRGVTRATVYMQPPMEGQAHIKEVIRKMITNAQKVVAVVMDMFTDVDIFKDMLDAGFKRKISFYIILDESNVKYFLQMCQRAQMHEGHLKNLRVQCIGGTEFNTRFSTTFRGAMAQKFIFVDGDKAACGSYSFTWSAARTDRNVLTVLTGQVVETFDKQFQELYLMSKAVSLKSVNIDPEPEPDLITQPPPSQANVAKKIINPKYALVKAKSSGELGAGSSGNQSGSKEGTNGPESNKKLKSKVKEQQAEVKEPYVHPALQNMEKANMFDYLPTYVEPEPEPGNEVLGYINIIDPSIKNAQLSQMNRIKICDTTHATAQHMLMLQSKEQEAKEKESQQAMQENKRNEVERKPVAQIEIAQQPVKVDTVLESLTRGQVDQGPIIKEEAVPDGVDNETSTAVTESPKVQTPERSVGAFALLAGSQHLVFRENEEEKRENSGTGPPRPVPKPRTVPVRDFISKNNEVNQGQTKGSGEASISQADTPKSSPKEVGTLNGTHRLTNESRERKNELGSSAAQNGILDDDDDEEYVSLSDPESSSDGSTHANHCPSNTSSNSEDYHDVRIPCAKRAVRRSFSELIPNGEPSHLRRQMSDSRICRGSFVSPFKDAQTALDLRKEQNGRRRNTLFEEEIRRALDSTYKLKPGTQGNDRIHVNDGDQGNHFFQYRSRRPGSAVQPNKEREGYRSSQQEKHPRHSQFRMDGTGEMDGYRHPAKQTGPLAGEHKYWPGKDLSVPRTGSPHQRHSMGATPSHSSPFSDHQAGPDSVNTPFGIPYSKLSESKHLKSRMAGQGDFRRRGHKDHL
ncbi:protein FAM83G [Ambystoma mexicanum]|uniref:protein FAM83G n=1 Tax=Ambystoma mexicanum TaxID=8296 RepID=UPI0037E951AF